MSGNISSSSGFNNWRSSDGGTKPSGPADAGRSGGGDSDKCAIHETTVLASPFTNVIASLTAGDMLSLELQTAPRNRVIAKIGLVTVWLR